MPLSPVILEHFATTTNFVCVEGVSGLKFQMTAFAGWIGRPKIENQAMFGLNSDHTSPGMLLMENMLLTCSKFCASCLMLDCRSKRLNQNIQSKAAFGVFFCAAVSVFSVNRGNGNRGRLCCWFSQDSARATSRRY